MRPCQRLVNDGLARSPFIADTLFQGCENIAGLWGGAVRLDSGKFRCTRCDFVDNKSNSGGAVFAAGSSSSVALSQTVFSGNTATGLLANAEGTGAIYSSGAPLSIDRSLFIANSAPSGLVGAIASVTCNTFSLTNSVVAKTSAMAVGAIYVYTTSSATTEATTFIDNTVTTKTYPDYGSVLFSYDAKVTVRDSILWAPGAIVDQVAAVGTGTITFERMILGEAPKLCVSPFCQGSTTIADPRLVQVTLTRPTGAFGRPEVYWAPGLGSPAIGGGGNKAGAAVDLLGNPRVSADAILLG
jgi:hypothetical protein